MTAKKPVKPNKKLSALPTGSVSRSFSLAKLGFQAGAKAAGHALGGLLKSETAQKIRKQAYVLEQIALLTKELGKLKGSLMKAGQMLSVYGEHFLPPEANAILKALQSDSPPLEWNEIRKVLVRQLGKERMALLEIDEEAFAAASLGQVHRAKIKETGQEIVLKVQYPGVDEAIDGDLKALRRILSISEWLPNLPGTDDLFAEVRSMLKRELDYELERETLTVFHELLKNDPRYILPRPIEEFSAKRVIAMTFEPGIAVDSEEVAALSQERRNALATNAMELYLKELYVFHKMQTDPHFGNYRVRLGTSRKAQLDPGRKAALDPSGKAQLDQLVLYDYGAVREISPDFLLRYKHMVAGLFHHDRVEFEKGARSMGILHEEDPLELKDMFYELCAALVEPFALDGPYDWKGSDLPKRVSALSWQIVKKFPLRAPPREVVFLDRKMIGIFTFMAVLGAKISARDLMKPYM
jgi:predicted unusual protein kinase regulating ubiquinone biosynthesis (AarF/ABC1/UbiB family)